MVAVSLIHYGWATILMINPAAADAIPIAILFSLLHARWAVVSLLYGISVGAWVFIYFLRQHRSSRWWSILCIPQQMVLLFSAGAGIYASWTEYVLRRTAVPAELAIPSFPWAHTLATEWPVIVMAVLYTIALVEFQRYPELPGPTAPPVMPVKLPVALLPK